VPPVCARRTWPVFCCEVDVLTVSTSPMSSTLTKRPRILIVEDHAPTRLAMSKLIRQAGADVVTARDGEEGLGYLLTQRFDVLLTDLRMPVMDGFELVHHCMKLPESHRPSRVIAISGEYEAGVLQGQPVQFMAKPFNLDTLLDMIGGKPN
jgi:two-component system, NarL family, sensor histidine kinase EvgS